MNDQTEPNRAEFSVWIFLVDGTRLLECRWVDAETAFQAAIGWTKRVAAQCGIIQRIIITDGGDYTTFEWIHGHGITFPPHE
jgi:hypothetical protein